jgi:ABC-2 type transport system ATP-binding protein
MMRKIGGEALRNHADDRSNQRMQAVRKESVLDGVDLIVEPEEILGVLGPSGSGKTTLIKCLLGVHGLTEGRVSVVGTQMPDLKTMDRIGYMAQQDALYEDLTGLQNLVFFGRLKGMDKKDAAVQSRALLELVGLPQNKKVVHYSGGMKRRLSLAAALIGDPEVIVLDEPTVGIDPALRALFWQEFDRLKARGRGIIVTTHVMDEADKCDRLILLRGGKIIEQGTPEALRAATDAGTLEAIFIRSAESETEGGARA